MTIEEYAKKDRKKYAKRLYWGRVEAHECTQCGKQDARTLEGRTRCAECAEKHNESTRKRREENGREKDVNRYRWRRKEYIENRCCHKCGTQDYLTMRGKALCISCSRKDKARQEKRKQDGSRSVYEKQMRLNRKEIGVCSKCGKSEPEPGRKYCTNCLVRERMYKRKYKAILNVL